VCVCVCVCVMYKPPQRDGEGPSWAFALKRKDCARKN